MRRYSAAVVVGMGKIALQCAEHLTKELMLKTTFIDTSDSDIPFSVKQCEKCDILYLHYPKAEAMEYIASIDDECLLLSVYNPWIIPERVLLKSNILAVNLHHAYLPYHPGRYAEAWAIYDQDEYAGITWHMISPSVDKGEIITQRKIKLSDTITSIRLLEMMNEAAFEEFRSFVPDLISGRITTQKQAAVSGIKFHMSKDRPNNGELDLSWDTEKISAFLRAYDYMFGSPFGTPFLFIDGKKYTWKKYKISHSDTPLERDIRLCENELVICDKNTQIILRGVTVSSEE